MPGPGGVRPQGPTDELGGAVFNLKYTPQAGAPAITNLHWIQAYTGSIYGNAFGPILDNNPSGPYSSQTNDSPFYDTQYFAGTLTNGGYFIDRPYVFENEYETNPVVSSQFQVVLANDAISVVGGVVSNSVTLYGGEWWGYTFSAVDVVPEPTAAALFVIGALGCFLVRRGLRSGRPGPH